jgi:uncharacterized membrane protein
MTSNLLLPVLMRWIHILAAITAVGGTLFLRFVLLPAASRALSPEDHVRLRETMIGRWQRIVHACILAFVVSGFYNYLAITRFDHEGQPFYHALFGIKFLMALCVFALAVILTSKRPWPEALRANMRFWGALLAGAAIGVVLISGVMKVMPKSPAEPPAAVTSGVPAE